MGDLWRAGIPVSAVHASFFKDFRFHLALFEMNGRRL